MLRECCVVYIQTSQYASVAILTYKFITTGHRIVRVWLAQIFWHAFSVGLNAMAKTSCTIAFDNNPQKVFFGGQTLSGRVVLTLHKEKTVRGIHTTLHKLELFWIFTGISIKIDGKAYCRWTQGSGDSKKTYIGEEVYLSERTYVVGDKTGKYYNTAVTMYGL